MDAEPATDVVAGRYALVERVGQGGMAQVWRAKDRTLQREVAVKTIDIVGEDHEQTIARFRREAIATAGLSDPYVVSVFDAGITDERAYLVMELLDGPSLAPLLKTEPPIEVHRVVTILRQVAQGLSAAHAIGITHRDIKPGNIVLHRGSAKIVDFGIARLTESLGESLTKTSTTIGTASYMSPEQALGQDVGPPSDIYALGVVTFAVLTGQPPFTGGSVAVARAHVSDPAPRLRSRRLDVDQGLDDLVAAMLAKDPASRPTAPQVTQALDRIAQAQRAQPHDVASATPPSAGPPPAAGSRLPFPPAASPVSFAGNSPTTGPRPGVGRPPGVGGPPTPHAAPQPSVRPRPMPPSPHPAQTGRFPPPPPGSVPVPVRRSGTGSGWIWVIVAVVGVATLLYVLVVNL